MLRSMHGEGPAADRGLGRQERATNSRIAPQACVEHPARVVHHSDRSDVADGRKAEHDEFKISVRRPNVALM